MCSLCCFKTTCNEIKWRTIFHGERPAAECPTFNKHRSAAFQIRYQVLSVLAPSLGVLFERCENVGACVDLLVLFHCLRTLRCRIEFSSLSRHLCARCQAVFGGIHPVKASIYTKVRSTTTGKLFCFPVCLTYN